MDRREKRKDRWRKRLRGGTNVNLISMMDVLTVLLLFLLKSYVAEGDVMPPAAGVQLPASSAQEAPRASLVIAITGDAIRVGDEVVASVAEAAGSNSPVIEALAAHLQILRESGNDPIAAAAGDPRLVTIQGDRDIEYRVLRKVMLTLSHSGFENVSLAVLRST